MHDAMAYMDKVGAHFTDSCLPKYANKSASSMEEI
jgi:hypothetical protein